MGSAFLLWSIISLLVLFIVVELRQNFNGILIAKLIYSEQIYNTIFQRCVIIDTSKTRMKGDKIMLTVEELRKQEERYHFTFFNHPYAYDLAMEILGIRIQLGGLVVFQYLMDKKDEAKWLRKKERIVQNAGVGFMLAAALQEESGMYEELSDYSQYCPEPGGFPIVVNVELVGSVCVLGLPELEDHELLIEALEAYKEGLSCKE